MSTHRGTLGTHRHPPAVHRLVSVSSDGVELACDPGERHALDERQEKLEPYVHRCVVGLFTPDVERATCGACGRTAS